MAEIEDTTLSEVTVTGSRENPMLTFMRQDFLKSSQFIFKLPTAPFDYGSIPLRDFSLFCESVEFPGKTIGAIDYKPPGFNKIRVPYTKDYPEITCTYIHNLEVPVYNFFATWLDYVSGSNTSTDNRYFDEVVAEFSLIQYSEIPDHKFKKLGGLSSILNSIDLFNRKLLDSSNLFKITDIGQTFINRVNNTQMIPNKAKYYEVKFTNAYPTSFASMPATWADDNYHRLTVTWAYEYYEIIQ